MPNTDVRAWNGINWSFAARAGQLAWRTVARRLLVSCVLALMWLPARAARADDCVSGRGKACQSNQDCENSAPECMAGTCQLSCGKVPAGGISEVPQPSACSLGEVCQAVQSGAQQRYACKAVPFRMDLNLLDSCIYHFVEGIQPAFGSGNACTVTRQLTELLDRNGDASFNIFDVDQCIKAYLTDEPCNTQTQTCPNSQTYCGSDATCGEGLFCNLDMHRCERECGFIPNRNGNEVTSLDRGCTGRLQTCDYERGRCKDVALKDATCQLDRECPAGAYCFVGQCQPRCYRTLDCPDSSWTCSTSNTCVPKPKASTDGTVFDPKAYSVMFARDSVQLDPFQNQVAVPIVIVNTMTATQVFSDPKVVFGYRLETKYAVKNDVKCNGDLTLLSLTEQAICLSGQTAQFLTLDNPYGTLLATGDPSLALRINATAASTLTPGLYPVVVTAYLSNGQSTSVRITFTKPSPSGEYGGQLSSYLGSPDAHMATTNVAMSLYIRTPLEDPTVQTTTWDALMMANHLEVEKEFKDITEGYPVTGFIHAAESLLFDNPTAAVKKDNEIPVKGLYSPELGRLRLIATINLAGGTCRNSSGGACTSANNEWQVSNAFSRDVRRIVEFIGPFRAAERRFEGVYRETISGLAPNTFTVEGGFRMTQLGQDTRPIALPDPLLPLNSKVVAFPTKSALDSLLAAQIDAACGATTASALATSAAVTAYFTPYGSKPPLFPSTQFSDLVTSTVGNVASNTTPAMVALTQVLAGPNGIHFCSEGTTPCVDQKQLACGLAFMRRAQLAGWFDSSALGTGANATLFCTRDLANPARNTCADPAAPDSRGAVMLQDQARFYRSLTQTYAFQANAAWSDAFYALYNATDPLVAADAFAFKENKLRAALKNYDSVRELMLASPGAAAMFAWPMSSFQTRGDAWLKQMQTALSDRLDAWVEFADLERRVLQTANLDQMFTFAKHVVNQEYLAQVMLAELQRQWQGQNFSYAGTSADVLARGSLFLAKLSDSRNPLGLSPNRVYFENSDDKTSNWQNYRSLLTTRLTTTATSIQTAVNNLHAALGNQASLQSSLMQTEQGRNASLDDLCGPIQTEPVQCRMSAADKDLATSCVGSACPYAWNCDTSDESGACATVVKLFSNAVDNVSCRSDIDGNKYDIDIKGAGNKVLSSRGCNHGKMGALLQERVKVDLQRQDSKRQVESLIRQIASQQKALSESRASNQGFIDYLKAQGDRLDTLESVLAVANLAFDTATAMAKASECIIIVGTSSGSDCPQKLVSAGVQAGLIELRDSVAAPLQQGISEITRQKEIAYQEKAADAQIRELRRGLDSLVANVENIIGQYQLQVQQLYNLDLQIADTRQTAQNIANRYGEQTADIVNRLVGTNSSQTLRNNELIRAADGEFQAALVLAYKMSRAYVHRFNYKDQAEVWTNRVYKLLTVADIQKFAAMLDTDAQSYCGVAGIDCDSISVKQLFRFSMREQLFPQLKDIVDPVSGDVLTKGMQFHNLITSSFRQRRVVSGVTVDQIELPFAIWANDLGAANAPSTRTMLSVRECNHVIVGIPGDAANSGTIAVNAQVNRMPLGGELKYQLYRGETDDIRLCDMNGIFVNRFLVGKPVIESTAKSFFQIKSNEFPTCLNQRTGDTGIPDAMPCWKPFLRERSLASPDYVFVIPLEGTTRAWILGNNGNGTPIPAAVKPYIEDIELFIRYNSRQTN
jgi:hypothetical protein